MKRAKFFPLVAVVAAALGMFNAEAAAVSAASAETVAANWAAAQRGDLGVEGTALSAVAEYDADGALLWWTVPFTGGGAVFVAPDDCIEPVLFATAQYEGTLPANHPLRAMLTFDLRARLAALARTAASTVNLTARLGVSSSSTSASSARTAAYTAKWTRLLAGVPRSSALQSIAQSNLTSFVVCPGFEAGGVLTHWNQAGSVYDFYTPYTPKKEEAGGEEGEGEEGEGEEPAEPEEPAAAEARAPCGCVATAMAAILQYYNVTTMVANIENKCTYNGTSTNLVTIGGTNGYVWAELPSNYGGQAPAGELTLAQKKILGRAAYDAGVCMSMEYTDLESGAVTSYAPGVFKANFGFLHAEWVSGACDDGTLSEDQCRDYIYAETMASNIVLLSIRGFAGDPSATAGHAVCGVGYGEDVNGTPYTRVFMGWGGKCDGWYALPDPGIAYAEESGIGGSNNSDWPFITGVATRLRGPAETVFSVRSVDAAIAAAQNSSPKKRILIVSGREGEEDTQTLIGILSANRAALEQDYVIFYAEQDGDYGLANPCVGVFDPDKLNATEETRWADWGGRLAYEDFVTETASGDVKEITEERFRAALASTDEDWIAAHNVCQLTVNGIYLTETNGVVMTLFGEINAMLPYDYPVQWGAVSPAYGTGKTRYAPGEQVALAAPAFVTNYAVDAVNDYDMLIGVVPGLDDGRPDEFKCVVTNRVVLKCTGWIDSTDPANVTTNTGNVATFTFDAALTNAVITWVWEPVLYAVETDVAWSDEDAYRPGVPGTTSFDVAWYACDDVVTVSAAPNTQVPFAYWYGDFGIEYGYDCANGDLEIEEEGSGFTFTMDARPHYLAAYFGGSAVKTAYDVQHVSDEAAVKDAAQILSGANAIGWDETTRAYAGPVSYVVPERVTDATGGVWRCTGWTLTTGGVEAVTGTTALAGFTLDADALLTWHWNAVAEAERIEVNWNHPHITSATQAVIQAAGLDLVDVIVPEKGWKVSKTFDSASQQVTVTLSVDEAAFVPPPISIRTNPDDVSQLLVEADVTPVVKWFWYAIYESTSPAGPYDVPVAGAEAKKYPNDDSAFTLRAVVTPGDVPKFYRVKITDEEPVAP